MPTLQVDLSRNPVHPPGVHRVTFLAVTAECHGITLDNNCAWSSARTRTLSIVQIRRPKSEIRNWYAPWTCLARVSIYVPIQMSAAIANHRSHSRRNSRYKKHLPPTENTSQDPTISQPHWTRRGMRDFGWKAHTFGLQRRGGRG